MKRNWFPILLFIIMAIVTVNEIWKGEKKSKEEQSIIATVLAAHSQDTLWHGLNKMEIPADSDSGKLISYGHELIANTAYYLGPKGTVAKITNGMNCQNCHLDGGTVPFGNNYGKVYSTYPQYRARNNGIQTIYGRVNDCLQRSLNGEALDSNSHEMKAIYAYIKWLGKGVQKGMARGGTSLMKLKNLDHAADPVAGRQVYIANCQSCHGVEGQGLQNEEATVYVYPPLWGAHSYNDGAGLYRISSFAGFVKNNMPFGTSFHDPKLTDEEAWNVAAFVNSQDRPHKDQRGDWQVLSKKPIDFPYGPYIDTFSELQHKFGPYTAIENSQKTTK